MKELTKVCKKRFRRSLNESEVEIYDFLKDNGGTYTGGCFCENGEARAEEACPLEGHQLCHSCHANFTLVPLFFNYGNFFVINIRL